MKPLVFIIILTMLFSCEKNESLEQDFPYKKLPIIVEVKVKDKYMIDDVFNFINSFNFVVENISNRTYKSALPIDSLNYIKDYISNKKYTNDGEHKWLLVYVDHKTNYVNIVPNLFNMQNKDYQSDWLETMRILKLSEITGNEPGTNHIIFHVPKGQEKKWAKIFESYNIVEWARWYYNIPTINPNP